MDIDETLFQNKVKSQGIEANAENLLAVCLWVYDQSFDAKVTMDWYNRLHDLITAEIPNEDDREYFDQTVFLFLSESQPEWWTEDDFPGPITRIISYCENDEVLLN